MKKKNEAKFRILRYMMHTKSTSKAELAKELNLSMPTVLTNVNELAEKGMIVEVGELESTGGRKAKLLAIQKNYRFSMGIDITANHIGMVLVNMDGEVIHQKRIREKFLPDVKYCSKLSETASDFLRQAEETNEKNVLGIGIALPGIIDAKNRVMVKSHALNLDNYSLKMMEQMMPLPTYFANDANAAMLAEKSQDIHDAVYLSLNHTLGGAICLNGKLFTGKNQKAGEFGHMIMVPGGKRCYCGKCGCADAYLAASVLTAGGKNNLEDVMQSVDTDKEAGQLWETYLENLAILISNLRMAYDTDIILGGDVGGYLSNYNVKLGEKIFRYNLFDGDLSYLKYCTYKREAAAAGAAKHFFEEYLNFEI
jgi:predicted NBD/HSP70 family sugar kinase/biotin operon repressor